VIGSLPSAARRRSSGCSSSVGVRIGSALELLDDQAIFRSGVRDLAQPRHQNICAFNTCRFFVETFRDAVAKCNRLAR